ncbi:MAG TPA: PfkB family carbohydrate kinase [Caldisericia bacterium]|nr:PfkB family carbohydrate kinase [Caldisericia bacterium]
MNEKIIYSFGSFTYDLIENHKGISKYCVGGSNAYFSLSSSIVGLKTYPVGYISDDIDYTIRKKLSDFIDLKYLKTGKKLNFHIIYNENLEANYLKDLDENDEVIDCKDLPKSDYAHVCVISSIKNQMDIIEYYKKLGSFVSTGTYLIRIKKDRDTVLKMLNMCDLFFLNKEESFALSNEKNFNDVINFFVKTGKKVIITLGKNGAIFIENKNFLKVDAINVDVVDVTGAGETFAGAFVSSYILYNDPYLSLKYGVILSSFVIEDFGINGLLNIKRDLFLKRLEKLNV